MEYSCQTIGDALEAALSGRLTFETQKVFRDMVEDLKGSDTHRWIIDMSNLEFIDSAGLGLLLRAKAVAQQEGRQILLRPPLEGQVRKMLDVSRFDQMFAYES